MSDTRPTFSHPLVAVPVVLARATGAFPLPEGVPRLPSRACPKGVDPTKAIQHLKRRLVLDNLHLARRKKPCQKLHGPGQGKPLPDIPAAPAKTV
jgi:hypothetical protein